MLLVVEGAIVSTAGPTSRANVAVAALWILALDAVFEGVTEPKAGPSSDLLQL